MLGEARVESSRVEWLGARISQDKASVFQDFESDCQVVKGPRCQGAEAQPRWQGPRYYGKRWLRLRAKNIVVA